MDGESMKLTIEVSSFVKSTLTKDFSATVPFRSMGSMNAKDVWRTDGMMIAADRMSRITKDEMKIYWIRWLELLRRRGELQTKNKVDW